VSNKANLSQLYHGKTLFLIAVSVGADRRMTKR